MDLTVVFTALILLALFVLPFYWIAHSKKNSSGQSESNQKTSKK